MTKILFVCLGNICRSPMAEGLLRKRIALEGREAEFLWILLLQARMKLERHRTLERKKILNQEKVDMTNMVARQITPHDFETFDWIIGMDQENVEELKRRAPRSAQGKIHLFLSSIPGKEKENVPDPYYTNNFDETYHLITEGLNHWWNIWIDENKITNNL
ncbi:low molecular weight phosphotyrosine protein phosphatase [Enterococcus faecium]|nr:low molecular weight phosphotyrosine protein phosphatase [Enterococcus faecium]MCC9085401.1 low molecular weight phosphotyrosine protein phosphatase [Enterococcus faecium]